MSRSRTRGIIALVGVLIVLAVTTALAVRGILAEMEPGAQLHGPGAATPGAPGAATPGAATPDAPGTAPESEIPDAAEPATVEYVHDGDTLFFTDGTKVRLLGVDTPEIGEHEECYGEEATELLRRLLPEGSRVMALADVQPLDQYGRSLLFLYREDGMLVNLELIERGAAEAVVLPPNVLFADELEAAEDRAQDAAAGMWGAC